MNDSEKILIADDEPTFLQSTADLLRKEGYLCTCAPNAKIAAKMLSAEDYNLLIADIQMPGNAELDLIKELPTIAEKMPVIIVTGYPSLQTAIQSINLPVAAYLVKPFEFAQLLSQVKVAIENYQIYRNVAKSRQQLAGLQTQLSKVEKVINFGHSSKAPLEVFIGLTTHNIVQALSDLKHIAEKLATNSQYESACSLLNCPRYIQLTGALQETIEVLEKTKRSFKSKELAALRKKLNNLLQNGGDTLLENEASSGSNLFAK